MAIDPMEKMPGSAVEAKEMPATEGERTPDAEMEEIAQEIEEFAQETGVEPAALSDRTSKETLRIENDPLLEAGELAGDAAAQEAKQELASIDEEGKAAAERAKTKAGSLFSRLRSFAGVARLAGAMSFLEACATVGAPKPEVSVRRTDKTAEGSGRFASREALLGSIEAQLAEQCTPEQIEAMRAGLGRWDQERMTDAMAEISGIDRAVLQKEGIIDIRMISDAELNRLKEADPSSVDPSMKAVTSKDKVLLRASAFIDAETGQVDQDEIVHAVAHEDQHARHSRRESIRFNEQVRPWDEVLPHGVQEGVTEILALRGLEHLGNKSKDQSYAGGNFAAGFLLDKTVGTRALARDYLTGSTQEMRKALETKFGRAGADRILRKHFYSNLGSTGNEPEALSTAVDIVRETARAGMDVNALVGSARTEGVVESMEVIREGLGIVLSKEVPRDPIRMVANAAVEDSRALSEHSPPVRVHVLSKGAGIPIGELDAAALRDKLRKGAELFESARAAFMAESSLADGFEEEEVAREAYARSMDKAFGDARMITPGETFNVVINAEETMKPFREAYDRATTDAERNAVRQQMAEAVARTAQQILDKIGSSARQDAPNP